MPPDRTLIRPGAQEPEAGLDEARPFLPNPAQVRYAKAYLDPAVPGTIKAIAEASRVNRRTVYVWLKDPQFCLWLREQADRVLQHRLPIMWQTCMTLACNGSPEHMKLIAQRFGELRQPDTERPGALTVFLNVPRPNQLPAPPEPDTIDVSPLIIPAHTSMKEH